MSEHNNHNKEIDDISGVETTGHEWDGLKELNNPLPRWWLWVLYVCIAWAAWYWVIYPSWPAPGGHTEGTGGYTQFKELADSQKEIQARQQVYLERFENTDMAAILEDKELYAFAMAGGASAFKDNCATCHGAGGVGAKGYPTLIDDDWLWGGTLSDIHTTLVYGIRADNIDSRISQMPAFGKDGLLKTEEVDAVVDYVLSLSGKETHGHEAMGQPIFKAQCASCHGEDGRGLREFGAPNLTDKIWLYGGDRDSVFETVYNARAGVMPAWGKRLDPNTIKQLTIYLHQLGGGEEDTQDNVQETEPTNDEQLADELEGQEPAEH